MHKNLLEYFNGDKFAADVWKKKYQAEGEITPDNMHRRLAKEFAGVERNYIEREKQQYNYHVTDESYINKNTLSNYGIIRDNLNEKSIYKLFKDFKYIIPQGRVMAGLGIKESFRSLSNCLRLPPPKDSYSSIMYTDTMLVSAAKRGCGYGLGLSNLRPSGTFVSNAANSSTGATSFMERYSNSTREVAQKGRRGACLLDMSIFHPDVLEFITKKKDRTKVTGANISVKLYDEFMKAVEKDEDFILRFPCDLKVDIIFDNTIPYNQLMPYSKNGKEIGYIKRIKAKKYWETIIENAWENAEPGLFFWDRVIDYDPSSVYSKYFIDGTNACGEQPMAVYDSCRLILLNLYSFVKNPFTVYAEIDYDMLYKMSYEQLRLGDDLVDLEIEYIDRIIQKILSDKLPEKENQIEFDLWSNVRDMAISGRRVGCGITALADMIAAIGVRYDSEKSIRIIAKVMKTKMRAELDCSTDLAILRGTFKGCNNSSEFEFHSEENGADTYYTGKNDFYQMLLFEFPEETKRMMTKGRRNVNWSTIAPAGSVSIIAKTENFCNMSSGCEPSFMPFHMRKTKINPSDKNVRVDFVDQNGDSWMEYPIIMGAFKEWLKEYCNDNSFEQIVVEKMDKTDIENYFEISPWYKSTANDINWKARIKIQSILQKYTTSAISSTLNLPKDISQEEVSAIYLTGWKEGLKGITIYRDGCRIGVLTKESSSDHFESKDAVKRPKELQAEAYHSTSKGNSYHVIVGLLENKPYEIFIDDSDNKYSREGFIVKEGRGRYVFQNGGTPINIRTFMNDEQEAITRLVSTSLRHGVSIGFICDQLKKTNGDIFSFTKSLARVLAKYITEDTPIGKSTCEDCGSENLKYQEGCLSCLDCGESKCN